MRKIFSAAVLATGLLVSSGAWATSINGNQLLQECKGSSGFEQGVCAGFVGGVADALDGPEKGFGENQFCTSIEGMGITNGQIRDVVVKWLNNNPSERHYSGWSVVVAALSEAFPCPK